MSATVQAIIEDALTEIGAIGVGNSASASDLALGLLRFQNQLDAWQAERLALSLQALTSVTWPSGTSTRTVGPSGNIAIARPTWINALNYVVPSSSPDVEVYMAPMSEDQYAALTIKGLQSGLPQQFFYQVNLDDALGTLFIWPQPNQNVTLKLYVAKGISVPAALSDTLYGPAGYQEAYMYQLALRLCTPFGRPVPELLPSLAQTAWTRMQKQNVDPGLLACDPALIPQFPGGYNVLSDSASAPNVR